MEQDKKFWLPMIESFFNIELDEDDMCELLLELGYKIEEIDGVKVSIKDEMMDNIEPEKLKTMVEYDPSYVYSIEMKKLYKRFIKKLIKERYD